MRELAYNELKEVSGGLEPITWTIIGITLGVIGMIASIRGCQITKQAAQAPQQPTPQPSFLPNGMPNPATMTPNEINQYTTWLDNSGCSDDYFYQWLQITGQMGY